MAADWREFASSISWLVGLFDDLDPTKQRRYLLISSLRNTVSQISFLPSSCYIGYVQSTIPSTD